jgi:tetratricopeptide (TPR) repeat protein
MVCRKDHASFLPIFTFFDSENPLVVKRLISVACAGAVWLSGCQSPGWSRGGSADFYGSDLRTVNRPVDKQSELVYLALTAEIAGQRGQLDVALKNYLELARRTSDPRIAERATQIAIYLKDSDQALEAVTLWLQRDPGNTAAHRVAALLYLKSGQTQAGIDQFRFLLKAHDAELENTLIELVKWLDAELPKDDALHAMASLVRQFPNVAELHFAYALLASDKGEQQVALAEAERALSLHPDWSRARLLQAQVMSQMGDSVAAREAVQKSLRKDPGNSRLRLIYAQLEAKSGNLKGAERELARILEREPGNQDARFLLASTYMEMGQQDRAREEFLSLTDVPKWQSQARFYLGLIEAKRGRMEGALEWFDRITSGPLEFDARVNAITALINLGRLEEARQRLGKVRKGFPNEALRLYLLEAELLTKNKDYENAFDLLGEALDEMPGQIELLYSRALVAEQLGRIDVLESDLRAVLDKNPNDPNALNALGFTLADRTGRLEEAKQYLDKAIALKPDDPAIMDRYGWLQYRLGNREQALEYLQKAYDLVRDPEIGAHYGEVLWESGRRPEAKRIWREVLRKDPDQDDMRRIRNQYRDAFR